MKNALSNEKIKNLTLSDKLHRDDLLASERLRNLMLGILVVFALGIVVMQARQILIPITLACFLSSILSPLVFSAKRLHIPPAITSILLLGLLLTVIYGVATIISEPASRWINELPQRIENVQSRLSPWKKPLEGLTGVEESIRKITSTDKNDQTSISVDVNNEGWFESLLTDDIPVVFSSLIIVIVLSYFLLISQGRVARGIARLPNSYPMRKQLITVMRRIKTDLSLYLITITAINTCVAVIFTVVLYFLGMPNPIFWGVLAGLFNFAPYVGPLIYLCLLVMGCVSTLASMDATLIICGTYVLLNGLEGNLITPAVISHRLSLSPVSVFVSVIVWTWLWGPSGALMAAPLLACFKIISENILKQFLSSRRLPAV